MNAKNYLPSPEDDDEAFDPDFTGGFKDYKPLIAPGRLLIGLDVESNKPVLILSVEYERLSNTRTGLDGKKIAKVRILRENGEIFQLHCLPHEWLLWNTIVKPANIILVDDAPEGKEDE